MAERKYKVVGPHTVLGHKPGAEFSYLLSAGDEAYFLTAGHLAKVGKDSALEPLTCEACQAHGTAKEKTRTFKDLAELRDHYGKDHPALAAPAE